LLTKQCVRWSPSGHAAESVKFLDGAFAIQAGMQLRWRSHDIPRLTS
jgi:hypothetical protein